MEEYIFRKLDSSEFELLLPLMRDCFGMDVNVNYFKWKYLDNPAGSFIGFVAVSEKNEVSAYYGVIPELYSLEGEVKTIYQSGDTMTHSLHRRRGLFQKLATMCYDYLQEIGKLFVIGFGGPTSTQGLLKFGWVKAFAVRYYFYPELFSILRKASPRLNNSKHIVIREAGIPEIKELIYNSNSSAAVHSVKTEEVFKWRISNPLHVYNIIGCFDKNKVATGYVCYYITGSKIFLFDYSFKTKKEGKVLMNELKRMILTRQLKGIVTFCQEKSACSRTLKMFGFISNPFKKGPLSQRMPFVFFSDQDKMNRYTDPGKWLINSFDHDAS